ncbi:hypothetical protein JX265_006234 [Neoarthrinium moseri]|uniref:Uncharacterized protein n=1 Tax=Neoarthrinium moseri TaxID=1658444 RepID=A0A9P9WMF7_9PEZI|nr:hypothetical protein JX265_006234 [Neoarthrinium moseri]
MGGSDFTTSFHKKPYGAISPLRAELSQTGRVVLITGGNAGIGYAAARAFGQAGALKVIITGRRADVTKAAAEALGNDVASQSAGTTEFIAVTCDIASSSDVERLWTDLKAKGVIVDVLMLNAAGVSEIKGILARGTDGIWDDYSINVRSQLQMTERFYKQDDGGNGSWKSLVMVSTLGIHDWEAAAQRPGYGLTKNAGTLAMQLIAAETRPERMQVVSFNPGPVFTENAKVAGYTEEDFAWNDPNLPGQFAVWAASSEARFLHGRFVWTEWDVDELKHGKIRSRIDEDPAYLRIGVIGL